MRKGLALLLEASELAGIPTEAYAFTEYEETLIFRLKPTAALSNIKKITSSSGVTEYDYDELNQLNTEKQPNGTNLTYAYDNVGNRIEKIKTKDGVTTSTTYAYITNFSFTLSS